MLIRTLSAGSRNPLAAAILVATSLGAAAPALAVPSFARQTGMACEACHAVFPELTHFGRVFKANGYRMPTACRIFRAWPVSMAHTSSSNSRPSRATCVT
jgi:hypothetical protein